MPKFYVSEHTKRKYAEAEVARKIKNQAIRQVVSEYGVKQRQALREREDAKLKAAVLKYNSDRVSQGRKAKNDIKMYNKEGFPYSIHLAKQTTRNRIEVLELDSIYYAKEVKRLKGMESDKGGKYPLRLELENTLNSINEELDDLRIDMDVDAEAVQD